MTRILGIDPGSNTTGYGIIELNGNHATHITHGNIRLKDTRLDDILRNIHQSLSTVISEYQPEEVAVEKVFMHRNADSALKLGQARGAAIVACAVQSLPVFEYTATQVKQAIVGKGHAAKQQVQHMIKVLLCLPKAPPTDAADALAIALCHGHSREGLMRMRMAANVRGGRLR